ncbi:hypothetical protein [Vibrio paucivorans]
MKKIFAFILFISQYSYADSIDNYYYYQVNKLGAKDSKYTTAVYLKKGEPCIIVEKLETGKKTKFCEMGESGFNLERDFPSVYPVGFQLVIEDLDFIVAAPWNEQKCSINLLDLSISCEATGR